MLLSFMRPRSLRTTSSLLRRSFAAKKTKNDKSATEMDDMEHGFALELKKAKAVAGEFWSPIQEREKPSPEFMEEIRAAAILHNKESQKQQTARLLDLEIKIHLKKEAVAALPTNFEGCRHSFDRFTSPLNRTPATHTPPIAGFKLLKDE